MLYSFPVQTGTKSIQAGAIMLSDLGKGPGKWGLAAGTQHNPVLNIMTIMLCTT
jgi:hypothetical protein